MKAYRYINEEPVLVDGAVTIDGWYINDEDEGVEGMCLLVNRAYNTEDEDTDEPLIEVILDYGEVKILHDKLVYILTQKGAK